MTELLAALIALGIGLFLALVLPLLSFIRASRAFDAVARLERRLRALEEVADELRARLSKVAPMDVPGSAEEPVRHPVEERTPEAPPPAATEPAPAPLAAAVAPESSESIETRIGSRWLLYVGILAIFVGAAYFVRHAFENEWITETMRVAIGGAAGLALAGAGVWFARRGYRFYGHILAGGGLALLYLAVYAALNFYALIGRPAAFVLMGIVTVAAAALAHQQRAQGLAVVAALGGFLTPFMIGGAADAQVALFTYDAILVIGALALSQRRGWSALPLVSYAFAVLTVASWMLRFYTPSAYLVTEGFLTLFAGLFVYAWQSVRGATDRTAALARPVLATAPVLYYLASIVILRPHSAAFLVFLIAVTLVGLVEGLRRRSSGLRLALWVAVALPLGGWLGDHATPAWLWPGLATIVAFYGMHLAGAVEAISRDGRLDRAETALAHLNGLGLYAAVYVLLEPQRLAVLGAAAAALALWNGGLARWARGIGSAAWVHFLAVAFVLAGVAVAVELDGAWVTIGWTAEAWAITWIGLRQRQPWLRVGGLALLAVAAARLVDLQARPFSVGHTLILNERFAAGAFLVVALFAVAVLYRRDEAPGRAWDLEGAIHLLGANAIILLVVTEEIDAFWELRAFRGLGALGTAELAREVTRSVAWAAYGVGLIGAGIRRRYAPLRYLAIVVLAITVAKVFAVDLARLDRIYRIVSVVGLGVLLLLASFLYQRYRSLLLGEQQA